MGGNGRNRLRMLGNALIGMGLLLMLGVGVGYAYSLYMEQQVRADPWLAQVEAAWGETATPTRAAVTTTSPVVPPPAAQTAAAAPTPTFTPTPSPTPRTYPAAVGMRIPTIGVDSRIVEVGVTNGEYEVPRFYVGHYRGTSAPGEPGNGIYTGHVESLDKGQVFASLPTVKLGAEILLYTPEGIWRYRISEIKTVPNTDLSVMQPTSDTRITLITCTGTFDWAIRQYTHRFIVIAKLVNFEDPAQGAS